MAFILILWKMFIFLFCGRLIEILDGDEYARIVHFHSPDNFGKSHKSFSVYSKRFRNGSEKIG